MKKFLLIDDDPSTLETTSMLLETYGVEVTACRSAQEAMKSRLEFDVALIDLTLPDMEGTEVIRTLKVKHPDATFIIASGWDDLAGKAEECGAHGTLRKPFDFLELERLCA